MRIKHWCWWDANTRSGAAARWSPPRLDVCSREPDWAWNVATCECAAQHGPLACWRYAHEQGCEWGRLYLSRGRCHGHLAGWMYAHGHGGEWNAEMCRRAAAHHQLVCWRYTHKQGCAWDGTRGPCGGDDGHFDILNYRLSNDNQLAVKFHSLLFTALANGS
jgi:hypothetical protein